MAGVALIHVIITGGITLSIAPPPPLDRYTIGIEGPFDWWWLCLIGYFELTGWL